MSATWTNRAADQLAGIRDYLARSSPAYDQMLVARLVDRADDLATQPLFWRGGSRMG
jgi:plasmid stabilization system protein ParE